MEFGEKLHRLRKDMKMSQQELAEAVGLTKRTISAYESGASLPKRPSIYKTLASVLAVDPRYLQPGYDDYVEQVGSNYGSKTQQQIRKILAEARVMFANHELTQEEEIEFLMHFKQLYLEARRRGFIKPSAHA